MRKKHTRSRQSKAKGKAKGLDTYDWKQCFSSKALSLVVLLAIMSGKVKLKLNWLLKFSFWSAHWTIFFTRKK